MPEETKAEEAESEKIQAEKVRELALLFFENGWEVRYLEKIMFLEDEMATFSYDKDEKKFYLSFNKEALPILVSNLTKFLIEHKIDYIVSENFSFDEEGNIVWESNDFEEDDDEEEEELELPREEPEQNRQIEGLRIAS